jgi:hypothetical protein
MLVSNPSNWHYEYWRIVRHWHAASEKYAGGDCLLTAINNGWNIIPPVLAEAHWRAGSRCVMVYHFTLERRGETMTMPVITNPFVERLIADSALRLNVRQQSARTA